MPRLRKPLFSPLNYGDQIGGGRIHGVNAGEQVARRDPNRAAKDRFCLDLPEKNEIFVAYTSAGAFAVHVHRDQETDRAGNRACSLH